MRSSCRKSGLGARVEVVFHARMTLGPPLAPPIVSPSAAEAAPVSRRPLHQQPPNARVPPTSSGKVKIITK